MRVLVTGGAGFIGSHLVDAYLARGDEVAVIDDLSSGRRENLNPAARFYQLGIQDPGVDEVLARERPEIVSHHAAQAEVRASITDPEGDIQRNIIGLVRFSAACARHHVGTFVFASTGGAIYGEPERNPIPEDAPLRPLSPYGVDKAAGELYLGYFHAVHGLKVRVLRYGNAFGPRQNPRGEAGVIAIFLEAMLGGERPRIFGDGTQHRDFVYIDDVVRAALAAPGAPDASPINIGTGKLTSINSLYQILARATGFREPPCYEPACAGEVHSISLDITRARERLQWRPEVDLVTGVQQTVEYVKQTR
jgi:UDP-glucose 4-epimerase